MEKMKPKSSLRSLETSLYDTCEDYCKLVTAMCRDLEVSVTEFSGMGVVLNSIIIQLKAIKELLCQRKEDIVANGIIYSCFKFPSLIRIRMNKSDLQKLEELIAMFAQEYIDLGKRLQPKFQEEAKNRISPKMGLDERLNNKEEPVKSYVLKGSESTSVYQQAVNNAVTAVDQVQIQVRLYQDKIRVNKMKLDSHEKKLNDMFRIING